VTPGALPGAVLFDLDGTVLESLPDIHHALSAARDRLGLPSVTPEQVRRWVGNGARRLVSRSLGTEDENADGVDALLAAFRDAYTESSGAYAHAFPGVGDLIDRLHSAGIRVACSTNKPRYAAEIGLARLGLDVWFDTLTTPDDVDGRTKPDPALFLLAAERLEVAPADCLVVGDGPADVVGARNAGMRVAAVLGGYGDAAELRALAPDLVLETAADLRAVLDTSQRRA